jgi:hypothetical protein
MESSGPVSHTRAFRWVSWQTFVETYIARGKDTLQFVSSHPSIQNPDFFASGNRPCPNPAIIGSRTHIRTEDMLINDTEAHLLQILCRFHL